MIEMPWNGIYAVNFMTTKYFRGDILDVGSKRIENTFSES